MENQTFSDFIKLYIKKNFSSIVGIIISIAGYIYFTIMAFSSANVSQGDYLPVMPMLVNLGVYLFSIMYVLDQIRFYLSPKSNTMRFLFHTQDNRIESEPPVKPFILPILSLLYRLFTYSGFFVGIITAVMVFLRQYYTDLASSILVAGILISFLYESYRIIAFLIAKTMNHLLGKKPSTIIIGILSFMLFVFVLV